MCKIETAMNRAITDGVDWKQDNTEVIYSPERDASYVNLHGNHIATIGEGFIELYTCGYKTNTTKSRLNAILREHGCQDRVYQRGGNWYVESEGVVLPFTEGMILSGV